MTRRSLRYAVLAVSALPFAGKAVCYAWIGSLVPGAILLGFVAVILWGLQGGAGRTWLAVRLWAGALAAWGLARLAVMALLLSFPISEAHVMNQMTAEFAALSVVNIFLGLALLRLFRPSRLPTGSAAS